jgi:hypothetical protein
MKHILKLKYLAGHMFNFILNTVKYFTLALIASIWGIFILALSISAWKYFVKLWS